MNSKLPKFENPPVVETVIGFEFDTLPRWQITHFGLLWNRIRDRYQQSTVQPPLPTQLETFENEGNTLTINLFPQPDIRCWFVEKTNNWLLQVQHNRFLSNWKKNSSNAAYPNYDGFRQRFLDEWNVFSRFLIEEKVGEPNPLQVEVSYINHIELESGFDRPEDVFPIWRGLDHRVTFLSAPEAVAFNTKFIIPNNAGRLYIQMQPVVRHSDMRNVLQLSITAKIILKQHEPFEESIDLAHEWVVRSFVDFTHPKLHEFWGRQQ